MSVGHVVNRDEITLLILVVGLRATHFRDRFDWPPDGITGVRHSLAKELLGLFHAVFCKVILSEGSFVNSHRCSVFGPYE